jgi:hypothetical protein
MPINVELRDEHCKTIDVLEGVYLTSMHLPDYNDSRYPYLRLIDPYGDTIFSRYQMVAVLPELETILGERRLPEIEAVLTFAGRCANEIHTYLAFVGDSHHPSVNQVLAA